MQDYDFACCSSKPFLSFYVKNVFESLNPFIPYSCKLISIQTKYFYSLSVNYTNIRVLLLIYLVQPKVTILGGDQMQGDM